MKIYISDANSPLREQGTIFAKQREINTNRSTYARHTLEKYIFKWRRIKLLYITELNSL